MASFIVQLVFNLGESGLEYIFPLVQTLGDPKEGMKATVIEGNRGDGVIVIPGGKKSQEIPVSGVLLDNDGYADLTTAISAMKTAITTDPATLTLRHWNGAAWITDWEYSVRRLGEIEFQEDSLRTEAINYSVKFLVISY